MALPARVVATIEEVLASTSRADLARAADVLSERYRATPLQRPCVRSALDALAYVAVRMPATYAAIEAAFRQLALVREGWTPATMLDAGAGPATATLAAAATWPGISASTLLEPDPRMSSLGRRLTERSTFRTRWRDTTLEDATGTFDLVVAAYVIGEAGDPAAAAGSLWEASTDTVVVVEPGTPAGYATILAVRDALIGAGGSVLAPCTHSGPCPMAGSDDWCHFLQRLPRSRLHRETKRAELGYEDERYSFVAVSRVAPSPGGARIVGTPRRRSGLVTLRLCSDAGLSDRTAARRNKEAYAQARRADWGDRLGRDLTD